MDDNIEYTSWVFPSNKAIADEFEREVVNKNLWLHIDGLPTDVDEFVALVKESPVKIITPAEDNRIEYRSHTSNINELIELLSTYKSWGTFRTPNTVAQLYSAFINNRDMDMPIVLEYERNGRTVRRVLGGNTRMDIARQLGVEIRAVVVTLEDEI